MGCKGHEHNIEDIIRDYRSSFESECKLFENPVFDEMFQGAIRPGGFAITRRAMELCTFGKGAKILDMGCGSGATVEFLQSNYDVDAVGIDLSKTLLERGKARNPELNLLYGDGEMLDFPSLTFDGVFMECTLSLMDNLVEALHEAYCVLKKGGKLIISDFYCKEPGSRLKKPDKSHGSCSHHHDEEKAHGEKQQCIKTCLDGAFVQEELDSMLKEIGFEILSREDRNKDLKDFTAALIMEYGSLDAFFASALHGDEEKTFLPGIESYGKLGYFLLIAEKR